MKKLELTSVYAGPINDFLRYREKCGVQNIHSEYPYYRKLDQLILKEGIKNISFTQDQASRWRMPFENESERGRYKRINYTKKFFEYLFTKGYDVFQFRDIKSPKSNFAPHIYAEDEVERYFKAVDSYQSNINRMHCVQIPLLFRILYCCGTRITETLTIRKKDVDLQQGIIKLSETKNAKERYVIMSESLLHLTKLYADRTFYQIPDDGYIFRNLRGTYMSSDWIHELHIRILGQANIPYMAGGRGPRIHDWRHSFAIKSFKQMIDNGMDMYVALPILSTYLGHKTILATERYLRLTVSMYPYIEGKFSKTLDEVFGKVEL